MCIEEEKLGLTCDGLAHHSERPASVSEAASRGRNIFIHKDRCLCFDLINHSLDLVLCSDRQDGDRHETSQAGVQLAELLVSSR